ncbi:phosphonoacetaldehyde hydrolase [Sphingomonas koreensis]|uniref:phosphonoacetaldehyde hydrolase n=2 Tax=Sphingomonas koreensis TaxID=93064 RepID=UPI00082D617D|nr:phosphonoacetaldehyde hydrolase [Sphingomonas koreensis]PJI90578.1 phosphonoacetaldehyde hydrolase [Sphingomonas koreensis]RSU59075.1 phosphonoacetaldehyde hydrolase [Sphingomonas koreensis]RSU67628.1 phosphonoacetaldehyde hydrolase [Sphingomonas koreensis]
MMSDIVAVLFDWAGTMIDFGSRAPVMAMAQVFERAGAPADEAVIRRYMGMAKREHVVSILSEPAMATRWRAAKGADWQERDVDALMIELEPAMQASAGACRELIPGAATAASALRHKGVMVGSTTGYTRTMMAEIIPAAAEQGYSPDAIVCAGETAQGRPAPLMLWAAMAQLGAWPASGCVAVDDAPVGITAGRNAGLWTIGVAGSGNGVGMTHADFTALPLDARAARMAPVVDAFAEAGADFVIESVADLAAAIGAIEAALAKGELPGARPTRTLIEQPV